MYLISDNSWHHVSTNADGAGNADFCTGTDMANLLKVRGLVS